MPSLSAPLRWLLVIRRNSLERSIHGQEVYQHGVATSTMASNGSCRSEVATSTMPRNGSCRLEEGVESEEDGIVVKRLEVAFVGPVVYEALSYFWGKSNRRTLEERNINTITELGHRRSKKQRCCECGTGSLNKLLRRALFGAQEMEWGQDTKELILDRCNPHSARMLYGIMTATSCLFASIFMSLSYLGLSMTSNHRYSSPIALWVISAPSPMIQT